MSAAVAVTATTRAAMPHIVRDSANHSWVRTRRLSTVIGAKPATTRLVGTAWAIPHTASSAAAM